MTALPLATNAVAAIATEADLKSFLLNQRDYLAGLFGTDGTAATARAALNVKTDDNTKLPLTGGTMSGNLTFSNAAMYINHYDTDWGATRYLHSNGGDMGFMDSAGNWGFRNDNSGNCFATGEVYSNNGGHVLSGKAGINANFSWQLVYTWQPSPTALSLELVGNWGHGIYCFDSYNGLTKYYLSTAAFITTVEITAVAASYNSNASNNSPINIYKMIKGA